ncbi:MAG: SUMF1/EgtB/PvdO family nonheme iron enzyme, partial [Verrucomicrobia bacterium]|nr:SUMF1/EgtB/PvdO family nonheme iron enzyme [Verrucomicrobiota bacterium]
GRLPAGYEYTLPTEAQWDYACRAGTTTALNSGKNLSAKYECPEVDEVGWYKYNGDETSHPVGQKQPNAWGLYDMHGNVWEWCLDWYGAYPAEAVTDPTGLTTGDYRVYRGASYSSTGSWCRSAYRLCVFPTSSYNNLGFRVALVNKNITIPLSDKVDLDMVWINPGTFTMGSPSDELGRVSNEVRHQVTLTQGYWLGRYEITQAQYKAVMKVNPSEFIGADLPVETVSWNDAMDFCAKLTEIEKAAGRLPEGYEYTLPTEAQWEYACRAGTTTALNSGKNLSDIELCPEMDEVGWYGYNSDETTHPAGQKQPNAWGLYDMHGNVGEWCLDWYGAYPASSVTDPTGPATGSYRVMRGGSWYGDANFCRSAMRSSYIPSYYVFICGFRVALAPVSLNKKNIPLSDTVDLAMSMVWCPAGTFTMGSPGSELGRDSDETRHSVTISRGFGIGKYEVTQAQYRAVMGSNPSTFKGDNLPVEEVAWYDAMEFCQKLTEIERAAGRLPESYAYTLPTEAQWEYACRAGTTTALNSGKNLTTAEDEGICDNLDEVGWYWMNGGKKNWNEGKDPAICTHPGGQKQPNNWGIYDMHGNVWEWCSDWYGNYPTSSVTDPEGPGTGSYRVLRGGSWYYGADHCRSAFRGNGSPSGNNLVNIGFRVALVPVSLDKTIPLSDKINLDMVWIEPGTFMMGSPSDELGRFSEEVRHQVTLTKDYW